MNKIKIVPVVDETQNSSATPDKNLSALENAAKDIKATIQAVPGAIDANVQSKSINIAGDQINLPEATFKVGGENYSVYNNLSPKDKKRAQELADSTNVRDDNTVTISTFGAAVEERASSLLDKALDDASSFDLDFALETTTDKLTKIIDTGLDLDLVYNDGNWLSNWIEKYLPVWMSRVSRFIRKTNSLRNRLEKIRKALKANGSELIGRMNLYDELEDQFQDGIDEYYIFAAASELIYQREYEHMKELIKEASRKQTDGRAVVAIKRQETTVFACIKRMFYLLGRSLTCFLKVNVLEEGLRAASLAFGSVMEASYGAIDDLKAALAMILNQYRTSKIHQQALQVSHSALEALQKAAEVGKFSIAFMEKMTEEQKVAINAYYKVGDNLVEYATSAKKVMADMKTNYNALGAASDAVTTKVNKALSVLAY